MRRDRLCFIASSASDAQVALRQLTERYGNVAPAEADVIVALGGDGHMLQTMHEMLGLKKPIYGMNRGSVGFLMNTYDETGLIERLARAATAHIRPLNMTAVDSSGRQHSALAINDVYLLRETVQMAKLRITVDGKTRLDELLCDGILVATPAGSTAYNLSAHGPVLPIDSRLLALTPISAFRPRRWRGALLPHRAHVRFEVLEHDKRPVGAVADHTEVRAVLSVEVEESKDIVLEMLFDEGHSLEDRIIAEQFSP
jgi:NAD+ kinase